MQLSKRFKIGNNNPTYIIAEIGINHCGNIELAKKMIKSATECGANCVKFQKRDINRILTKEGLNQPYFNENSFGSTYGEHKIALEFSFQDFKILKEYADSLDVDFSASGWDELSIDFLDELNIPFFKIASADLTNLPLLKHTSSKGKPMIISTGMSNIEMIDKALSVVTVPVVLMHCTSSYPAPFEDLNLNVLKTFQEKYPNVVVGYSCHSLGIAVPLASVILGAKVIESHFTLDRTMKGSDQASSLEPEGLKKLIRDIRVIEKSLGSYEKNICKSEEICIKKLRKSLVSAKEILKGEIIDIKDLTIKGPGTGICPSRINEFVGKITKIDIQEDIILKEEMFEI